MSGVGLAFPDHDHEPQGMAHEYLYLAEVADSHWNDGMEELPPEHPYTGSTFAVPISGDHLARLKAAIAEEVPA